MRIRVTKTLVYEGEEAEVNWTLARSEESCSAISADKHRKITIKILPSSVVIEKLQ